MVGLEKEIGSGIETQVVVRSYHAEGNGGGVQKRAHGLFQAVDGGKIEDARLVGSAERIGRRGGQCARFREQALIAREVRIRHAQGQEGMGIRPISVVSPGKKVFHRSVNGDGEVVQFQVVETAVKNRAPHMHRRGGHGYRLECGSHLGKDCGDGVIHGCCRPSCLGRGCGKGVGVALKGLGLGHFRGVVIPEAENVDPKVGARAGGGGG